MSLLIAHTIPQTDVHGTRWIPHYSKSRLTLQKPILFYTTLAWQLPFKDNNIDFLFWFLVQQSMNNGTRLEQKMKAFRELSFFVLTVMSTLCTQQVEMIVFVHGTLRPADFSLASIIKIMGNNIGNSLYSKTNSYIREDPYFYQSQAMQGLGLHPIHLHAEKPLTVQCLAKIFELQYEATNYPIANRLYYTFGWNGLLNIHEREKEGEIFYQQLSTEIAQLKAMGKDPQLHIVAFSHGGNVSLNLAKASIKQSDNKSFTVETLTLLGMPVQRATDYLANSNLFKKIYHIYSTEDSIQTLDIFSPKQFFSDRTFKERSEFKLPEKLVQIRIRVTRSIRGLHKINPYPEKSHQVLAHKNIQRIHKDPQHTELWCFKWGAHWYRDLFPLKPLPIVAFVPSLLHAVQSTLPDHTNITLDYVPSYQGAVIIPTIKYHSKTFAILTKEETKKLYALAQNHEPKDFSLEKQQEKIEDYLKKAQLYLKELKGEKAVRKSRLLTNLILRNRKKLTSNRLPYDQKIIHG